MPSYAALLRGIGPSNPNMRGEKLHGVLEGLGFEEVGSVLASGNLVFATDDDDQVALEERIQAALQAELGIPGGTIVRSRAEIEGLVARAPFGSLTHGRATYLTATFLKAPVPELPTPLPQPEDPGMRVQGYDELARAVLAVTDNTGPKTPDFMVWLEKQFSRDITTRTWLTVQRVLAKLPPE
ncbi:DUF1697 domain-containing protein [Nocardioides limicola]|uniref:DUF1697 domain-containing protein n=1 Tax=Nocardioides limicola TaxID=2803368 RepID=UPI00193BF245|nr:DUF1697 domain-containing protein [Nocardioides sp. DJM-14]